MVFDGASREDAARAGGMDRQTLRDWVHRYNEAGVDGLADQARSGRPARLSWVEQGRVARWVEQGAELAQDGVVRFRRVENIWAYLRANKFSHQVWNTYQAILDAACAAWNDLTRAPHVIRSIGMRKWAEVTI